MIVMIVMIVVLVVLVMISNTLAVHADTDITDSMLIVLVVYWCSTDSVLIVY